MRVKAEELERRGRGRDLRFEVVRIVAMYLIVCCHVMAFMPWGLEELAGMKGILVTLADKLSGQVGVSLFVFISGWFAVGRCFEVKEASVRAPLLSKKLLQVVVQTLAYSWAILVLCWLLQPVLAGISPAFDDLWADDAVRNTVLGSLFPVASRTYWFVTSFAVLLLFAPVLDRVMEDDATHERFLLALMVMSLAHDLTKGIHFFNEATYLVMLYVMGGWLHKNEARLSSIGPGVLTAASLCAVGVLTLFIASYMRKLPVASYLGWDKDYLLGLVPAATAVVAAVVLILILGFFERNPIPERLRGLIGAVSSSTFGVYLIHFHPLARPLLFALLGRVFPCPTHFLWALLTVAPLGLVLYAVLTFLAFTFNCVVAHPLAKIVIGLLGRPSRSATVARS